MKKGLVWLWGASALLWLVPNFTGDLDARNIIITCMSALLAYHNYESYKRGE